LSWASAGARASAPCRCSSRSTLTGTTPPDVFGTFWTGQEAGEDVRSFAERLVLGVTHELRALDRAITVSATNWRIERMAVVDRNVLRMAVYELLHDAPTPPAVVIDEAIEVAKKFGSEDSGRSSTASSTTCAGAWSGESCGRGGDEGPAGGSGPVGRPAGGGLRLSPGGGRQRCAPPHRAHRGRDHV
jgi:N utilization substance protein B